MSLPVHQRVLLAVLLAVGGAVRVAGVDEGIERTPDERTYTRQALVWLQSGRPGIKSLVAEYRSEVHGNYFPMPTRAGMIQSTAAVMRWTGRLDPSAGTLISCAASIASLFLLAFIGVRFFPPWATITAVLCFAVFPASLAIARRAWTDSLVELISLVLFWLTCEIMRSRRPLPWCLAFALVGSVGLTIKEPMLLTWVICGFWLLWVLWAKRRDTGAALFLLSVSVAGLAASIAWMGGIVGGVSVLLEIVGGISSANAANPYALAYASGSPWQLVGALWLLSPGVSVLALAGLYVAFKPPRQAASNPAMWCGIFVIFHVLLAMLVPHWLNVRYVAAAFGPLCMLAGLGGWHIVQTSRRLLPEISPRLVGAVFAVILLLSSAGDYRRFQRIFVQDSVGDLAVGALRNRGGL